MTKPDRLWFTVKQLAKRWEKWGITPDDIEHYVYSSRLFYLSDVPPNDPAGIPDFKAVEDYSNYISLEEVKRFEKEELSPFTVSADTAISGPVAVTADYLDSTHTYYSEELATAVNTWLELYGNGKIKTKQGHKSQIEKVLAGKGLSASAIDRIATLVNPNKKGGAPSIDS